MKKLPAFFAVAAVLILLVSCASMSSEPTLTGIWKYEGEEETYIVSFTEDGLCALEVYLKIDGNKELEDIYFGRYTFDETEVETPWDDLEYSFDGSKLILGENVYKRTSRTAKNNTSPEKLKGLWEHVTYESRIGITSDNYMISNLSHYATQLDFDEDGQGSWFDYAIINDKLYVEDYDYDFNDYDYYSLFTRKSSAGKDTTSKAALVKGLSADGGIAILTTVGREDGERQIYTFKSNGKYFIEYYSLVGNSWEKYDTSNGTWEFDLDDHMVYLSNDADLDYAIIDSYIFMFT